MNYNDSNTHVIKTSAQWNERAIEYWVVPRGCLCVELTPKGKTKIKIGEGNKNYYQLPYIGSSEELYNYYTKEEVDALLNNFNRMAIMSTDEYPSKRDLPMRGNKVGDVRFVAPSSPDIKPDPDLYVWDGRRWIYTGSPLVDMSEYVKTAEFNIVKNKVDQIFPMAHTHANKAVLDNITQEKLDEIDELAEMYDGVKTDITDLKSKSHTHSNKSILDSITQSSLWTQPDRDKFNSLHNYDDTEVKFRLVSVEEKAHTHANKTVLDGITQEKLDAIDELAATYVIVVHDINDLKTKSHTHANKDILDGTNASYTIDQQNELNRLSQISTFIGAGPTWNGTFGYVPAPEMGQQTYFLRADGTWALIKATGDKYKAGEGITILSGEVISDTFPFEIFPKAATVTQYVIYGTASGVGDLVSGHYEVPIKVSAPGHTDIIQTISLSDPLYDGDYIDFQKQVFAHYRTEVTNQITTDPSYSYKKAIYSDGVIRELDPGAYGDIPRVSRVYELMSGATYELTPWNVNGYSDFNRFRVGQYLNIYDADMNITRTLYQEHLGNTLIIVGENEKYMRMTVRQWADGNVLTYQHLYQLYPIETPCVLQALTLHPGVVNTVDVLTTNKPNEIYVEVVPPDDEDTDPDDPMSEYTGIIYNDGILDVTQEDPNALNELTFHFRDDVDKTLTIPSTPLPIASDTTLGGIKVGANLTIDPETGVLDATGGGTTYVEGDGIEFGRPILETYQVLDKIRKPSGTTLTTDVMPSGTADFFCDLKYYKYSGSSFLILCYNGERGSFCYMPATTNSGSWARMWIYTAHENWYDLYLNGSFASSSPIVAHLRWGNTMSMSFDHTSTSAQNSPGVLPGHNRFRFDSSSDADLYWAKFYENSVLVGELVPVIRQSDNAIGMFNKVTETFSTVSGLTAGTPTGETIVIYDQSSTQNIPINAKLGVGLTFDANDAITLDDSITIRFNCNNDPNEY